MDVLPRRHPRSRRAAAGIPGERGSTLIKICLRHVDNAPEHLREAIRELCADAAQALERRNKVVHSVVVSPGDPVAYAHRLLRSKQRPDAVTWSADESLTADVLVALTADLMALTERLMKIRRLGERVG